MARNESSVTDPIRVSLRPSRPVRAIGSLLAIVVVAGGVSLDAQVAEDPLPLRRTVPGEGSSPCAPLPTPAEPGPEARRQAAQLGSTAAQQVILGDLERARDLLDRATQVDPTSIDLAYRRGRILQDLGETEAALEAFCRAAELEGDASLAADAQARIQELSRAERESIPSAAVAAFRVGVADVEGGRLEGALRGFDRATALAPGWADAHYNRGVVLARLGRSSRAQDALRRYLELRPDAPDAIAVSERIGELQVAFPVTDLPSPGVAFAVGLIPGMGQVYTGRAGTGAGFLALTAAPTLSAFFIERGRGRRYFEPGLAIASTITLLGATEAAMYASRLRAGGDAGPPDPGASFALGLIPGLGHYHQGRTGTGMAFMSLVAGALTASDLAEDGMDRRFVLPGLVVTGGIAALGAADAAFWAARAQPGSGPPNPVVAAALGVVPGLGQFYSGRSGAGLAVLTLAAAPTATAFLYEEGEGRGLFSEGLITGAVVTAVGMIEAYFGARGMQQEAEEGAAQSSASGGRPSGRARASKTWAVGRSGDGPRPGDAILRGPGLVAGGPTGLGFRLVGWTF